MITDQISFTSQEVRELTDTLRRGQLAMELADKHIKLLEKRIIELELEVAMLRGVANVN